MQRYLECVDGTVDKKGNPKVISFNPRIALLAEWRVVMPSEKDQTETEAELREVITELEQCLLVRYNITETADPRQGPPKLPSDIKNIKTVQAWLVSARKDLELAIKREKSGLRKEPLKV